MPAARSLLLATLTALTLTPAAPAQLRAQIERIAAQAHGRVGVSCSLPGKPLDCDFHPADPLPMQSVYKLPISMAMLHAIEQGRFTLTQTIRFLPSDLIAPDQYSPLRDAHPHGDADIPVQDLIHGALVDSDGVASDMLMRALGGPAAVSAYIRSLGIHGIEIRDTEKTLGRDVQLENRNTAEPRAMVALLRLIADHSPLTPDHTSLLLGWMRSTHTGDHRLRALLPPGTVVADKTGTAGTGRNYTNATNDVGLITLPDGRILAVAVLVADSAAPEAVREHVIAEIGQAIWNAAMQTTPPSH
jgi:beta-lactamase class A